MEEKLGKLDHLTPTQRPTGRAILATVDALNVAKKSISVPALVSESAKHTRSGKKLSRATFYLPHYKALWDVLSRNTQAVDARSERLLKENEALVKELAKARAKFEKSKSKVSDLERRLGQKNAALNEAESRIQDLLQGFVTRT